MCLFEVFIIYKARNPVRYDQYLQELDSGTYDKLGIWVIMVLCDFRWCNRVNPILQTCWLCFTDLWGTHLLDYVTWLF